MTAEEVLCAVEATARRRGDAETSRHPLAYRAGRWDLLRVASRDLGPAHPVVLVLAGLHGDERAGPETLALHLDEVLDAAHGAGRRAILYPLANPSGFDAGLRYNADHDAGPAGNGDFLRYRLADGRLVDELPAGARAAGWCWSGEVPGLALPVETRALQALLRADPLDRVVAALDLHQDGLTPGAGPGAYHYAFGDLARYRPIVAEVAALVPVWRRRAIAAGFGVVTDADGRVVDGGPAERAQTSDDDGFLVRHDGSFVDLLHRLGAAHAVTVETTTATPPERARRINLIWLRGLARL